MMMAYAGGRNQSKAHLESRLRQLYLRNTNCINLAGRKCIVC